MKTFRITFTDNPESGIYSANLVNAESAEQAAAYFQTLGNYKIIGCAETNEEPKPGQPVHTVPEGWEAPEEETAPRTYDEITADILAYFKENEEVFNDCIEELDRYNGCLTDDRWYNMDDLPEIVDTSDAFALLNMAYFGDDLDDWHTDENGQKQYNSFNPNREYVRFNGYGNLESSNWKDYRDHMDAYAVREMDQYRSEVDSIDEDETLAALFDELEEVEE